MKASWDSLRLVLAIVDGNGLSGAAKKLGVHHATVLRQLDTLEHQTGVVLFNRKYSGYTATVQGMALANKARKIELDVEQAYLKLAGEDLRISGTIRIATSDFLSQAFLTKALLHLSQSYPEINTEINVSSQFASLGRRDADVALRAISKKPAGLKGKQLATLKYGVYVHKSMILDASDLNKLKWIIDDETMIQSQLHKWMYALIAKPTITLRANSTMVKYSAVKQGIGASLLPRLLGDADDDLICIRSQDTWSLDIWFLSHSDLYNMQRVKALETALFKTMLQ
ncbi:LysR family transcriptional regulator [Alteromonas sp. 5E99-2]|uniref:LysR family transcriptional regulator n=1 Tax=Alteromonas sp. 5E99-2 TaxID=2817683 RepID=UPI001A99D0F3|nr:LysR family transcriptional regulator [Alteromonas sp. 5E99-2]MBO1254762.1 LysR family transcriptional regulator [Alteromonas sp. 5E99-2]